MKKMKKMLLAFLTFISLNVIAQNDAFKVKEGSFNKVEGCITIPARYDDNDKAMAVLKIIPENINEQDRKKLNFEGNLATFIQVEQKTGETWVYLTAEAATFLRIKHPDFGVTEFNIPMRLQAKQCYEMVLQYIPIRDKTEKPKNNFLIISVDQHDAAVFVDDEYVGNGYVDKSVLVNNEHTYRVECDLYHTETGKFMITEGEPIELNVNLRPAYGFLNVNTTPEQNAMVYIDNKNVGTTPYKSDKIASGTYSVRVVKTSFETVEQTFVVTDGNTTEAELNMLPIDDEEPEIIYGHLELSSKPYKADIYIDGKYMGQTPRVISDIVMGQHELKLQKEGCVTVVKDIFIKGYETLTLNETLQMGSGVSASSEQRNTVSKSDVDKINFVSLNVAYSLAPQLSYGLTYGQVRKIGWFVNAMSNFGFRFNGKMSSDGKIVFLSGNETKARLSFTGGLVCRVTDNIYAKVGAGYGMRVRCVEDTDGNWYNVVNNTYKGVELSAGMMCRVKGYAISADVLTTNFKYLELKLGVGINWRKNK